MKIFFFDIDGTLLEEGKNVIAPQVIQSVNKLSENHKVFICTGRSLKGAEPILNQLNVDGYVLSNGQEVVIEGQEIYTQFFRKSKALEVVELIREHDASWSYENRDGINVLKSSNSQELVDLLIGYGFTFTKEVEKLNLTDVFQIWAFGQEVKVIADQLKDEFHYYQWTNTTLEITPCKEGKGKGVEIVKKHYQNQGVEEIITHGFGDGLNDFTMMEKVDISIAMGNADERLKVVCDIITDNVTDNGLINAIDKLV